LEKIRKHFMKDAIYCQEKSFENDNLKKNLKKSTLILIFL